MAGKVTRFITLTLRASNTPLTDQIDRLFRSFRALRVDKNLGGKLKGGAAFGEIKIGERSGRWHPHLHVIAEGAFIDQKELSRAWHRITGDSTIVDIKRVDSVERAASYVAKYVTKPADASVFANTELLDEFVCAIAGRRLCSTFGSWRGFCLDAPPPDDVQWITLGSVHSLRLSASDGNVDALRWLEAASRKWPLFGTLFSIPPPTDDVPAL